MPRRNARRRLEDALARYSEEIRAAFLEGVQEVRDAARIAAIAEALDRGDILRAIDLVGVEPVVFRRMERAIIDAYGAGGVIGVGSMPVIRDPEGVRILVRFDPGSARAAERARQSAARLVTRVVEDQRQAIRTVIVDGLERGVAGRKVATDIVGMVNRASGKREGGIIGLTSQQASYVVAARRELLSGDPDLLRNYLTRTARDRRFDASVKAAIDEGRAISADKVGSVINAYENRLLAYRGEVIGRTEATAAVNAGQGEAFEQMLDQTGIARQDVIKTWRPVRDKRTRDTHAAMEGETVGYDQPYSNGLMYPGDPSGPVEEIIQCRCVQTISIRRPQDDV